MRAVPRTWALAAIFVALALVAVREVAIVLFGFELLGEAGTLSVQFAAILLVVLAARGRERPGWLFVAAGMAAWTAGDLTYFLWLADDPSPPVPSWADAGYLLFPPLVCTGLALLLRGRIRALSRFAVVDGVVAALAVAAASAAVVVHEALHLAGDSAVSAATTLAYPLSDLVLLGFVAAAAALSGWRLDRTWSLVGAALISFWLADSGYLLETSAGTYGYPDPIDGGWDLAFVLLAAAAWQPRRPVDVPSRRAVKGARQLTLPLVFGTIALTLLLLAGLTEVTPLAVGLAGLAMAGVLLRLALSFQENDQILDVAQRDSLTDALTGLGNRRALSAALASALEHGPESPTAALVLFDLDGFKHYNDTFGHPAGDALLARLAAALEREVGPEGQAFRMGGDEFCALLPLGSEDDVHAMVHAATAALSERGESFTVTSSCGAVLLPAETHDATDALRLADQRLYTQKQGNRMSAGRQSRDVLLRALVARHPDLATHSADVARLAAATAREVGLDPSTVQRVRHAAELHDVGKVGIPDAILDKRGPLDPDEWAFIRRHTIIGERIIGAAPALREVALMVRGSHERWDGRGYPDGLAGEEIPLGARIVAVADTFDAMTSDRPYAAARTVDQALDELRRCAGTQFDPQVVAAFCVAVETELVRV